jgi:hypothetical protein
MKYIIQCRIKWAIRWCYFCFGIHLLMQTFRQNTGEQNLYYVKKYSILTFCLQYRGWGEMSYIPFCRASQALSIGIWFNLNREIFWKKKSANMNMKLCSISLKGQCSSLALSPWERFEKSSRIWFDAEFNGLQNGV